MKKFLTILLTALTLCSCADGKVRQYKLQVVNIVFTIQCPCKSSIQDCTVIYVKI